MKVRLWLVWNSKRFFLHLPIGLLYAIADIPGAIGLTALFALYEINEDRHVKDSAYIDVQGALAGVIIAIMIRWLT